jgi:hypothetical protein
VELCGVRTETCPAGMKTGDQVSPPGGYVGGGLLVTDLAINPAGDVWLMNNWQDIDSWYFAAVVCRAPGLPLSTATITARAGRRQGCCRSGREHSWRLGPRCDLQSR